MKGLGTGGGGQMGAPRPRPNPIYGTPKAGMRPQPLPGIGMASPSAGHGAGFAAPGMGAMPNRHPTPGAAPLSSQMARPPAAQQHNAQGSALAQLFQAMMGGRR